MRFDDVWITGTGGVLGELLPVRQAVTDGRYAAADAAEAGMTSVSVSVESPPEMAVRAGRLALGTASPGLHLHGAARFQGIDLWSASCWIASRLLPGPLAGLSMQVNALCNSGLAALELAATTLTARQDLREALITVADWFPEPAVDRWNLDSGVLLGDGGAAAVLGRGGGQLRLLSCVSWTDPSLEGLQRGNEPFHAASPAVLKPLVLRRLAREFYAVSGRSPASVVDAHVTGVRTVVAQALAEAGTTLDEARWAVPPFVGRTSFRFGYAQPLGLDPARTLVDLGLSTGHMGGVDHLYALDHLLRGDLLAPGDKVVLIGVGGGFTFSCAVLQAA
ncbi:ketoacyl-ACP synthase III family protein [Saccharothrix deserti]|uniref:ketoacyl-ACP synthase III family protein n=1 Tax=Saccharothrix deserti TaxID=2593674 RepID=UPI00131AB13C|nr:ketoacyl-ACP synthase III family protein [Saccharothrix deserti]